MRRRWTHAPPRPTTVAEVALMELAAIDPLELCKEAKDERCRAVCGLRRCGQEVRGKLVSCGHASLCDECVERFDACPICRAPTPASGSRCRTRLYIQCLDSGLVSVDKYADMGGRLLSADVRRLFSLFDVALENNMASLVCQCIILCMDERAAPSYPDLGFLLDVVVVKDWCAWSFQSIVTELYNIYSQVNGKIKENICLLVKYLSQLSGIATILESSFMNRSDTELDDTELDEVQMLLDNVLRAKQHLEMTNWCINHDFLEKIPSYHKDFTTWCTAVEERKTAAVNRCWPSYKGTDWGDLIDLDTSTLFIEDAIANLEFDSDGKDEEVSLGCQLKGEGYTVNFNSKIGKIEGSCYPFVSFQAAVDFLFLHGSPYLAVAKRAILLYFLYDRQWRVPDSHWKYLVDDFAATFSITEHIMMESFALCLLDDHSEEAMKKVSCILPEIANGEMHPKVARVLLERQQPELALTILRRSRQVEVSIADGVTGVRVRVECGHVTEAFMYQRAYCKKVKEQTKKTGHSTAISFEGPNSEKWMQHMSILVTEICHLSARRNLVERLIQCPWNSDEEKYLHTYLFERACEDPTTTLGSFLAAFYLRRHRYEEAYEVHQKLQSLETKFLSNSISEETASRMKTTLRWRCALMDRSISNSLLPEANQQQLKPTLLSTSERTFLQDKTSQMIADQSSGPGRNLKPARQERTLTFDTEPHLRAKTACVSHLTSNWMFKPKFTGASGQPSSGAKGTNYSLKGLNQEMTRHFRQPSIEKNELETNGLLSRHVEKAFPAGILDKQFSGGPNNSSAHTSVNQTSRMRPKMNHLPIGQYFTQNGFTYSASNLKGKVMATGEVNVKKVPSLGDAKENPPLLKGERKPEEISKALKMRLLVDENEMRVVYAECNRFIVDMILSFLTLPVGAVIRRLGKHSGIGQMDNLYGSVETMKAEFFETLACRYFLLHPRSASGVPYHRLKFQLNGVDKYLPRICPSMKCPKYSLFKSVGGQDIECECGLVMTKSIRVECPPPTGSDGVFLLKKTHTFLVTDDLFICPSSIDVKRKLCKVGGFDHESLKEHIVDLDNDKIINLLRNSILTNTPLTRTFLSPHFPKTPIPWPIDLLEQSFTVAKRNDFGSGGAFYKVIKGLAKLVRPIFGWRRRMIITLVYDKEKVLYAKGGEDFVNLLFSFLTFPLGSIVAALGGFSYLGCLDNVHEAAKRLILDGQCYENNLLNPSVAHHHGFPNQLLHVGDNLKKAFYVTCPRCHTVGLNHFCRDPQHKYHFTWEPINPKYRDKLTTKSGGGYVRSGPFIITNEFLVKPLNEFQVDDLQEGGEEKRIVIDQDKAIQLLLSCLNSKRPLDDCFPYKVEPVLETLIDSDKLYGHLN